MTKLIAILIVITWSGFWAFGYLSLTGDPSEKSVLVASILAFQGGAVGIFTYLWLIRHSEAAGNARAPRNMVPAYLRENEA